MYGPVTRAAERGRALGCYTRAGRKTAAVHLTGKVKSFGQVVAPANPDIGIGPTFGQAKSTMEHIVQGLGDFRLRRYRVLPGRNDELEQFRLLVEAERRNRQRRVPVVEDTF